MSSPEPIERVFREEYARIVATLVRRFGDIDVAEEAAGQALVLALEKWPVDGVPPNPRGWLTTTAGNKAIDRLRREGRRHDKHPQAAMEAHLSGASEPSEPPLPTGPVTDDRLRLVFTAATRRSHRKRGWPSPSGWSPVSPCPRSRAPSWFRRPRWRSG